MICNIANKQLSLHYRRFYHKMRDEKKYKPHIDRFAKEHSDPFSDEAYLPREIDREIDRIAELEDRLNKLRCLAIR